MFEDLQRIFRQSLSAFRSELHRHEPEDQVAELLSAMRREWVAAKADLPLFTELVQRAEAELAREREMLAQTERRGRLAQGIGDAETVRVATEFAGRHRERIVVLEQKVSTAQAERALRLREAEEMKVKYQEADKNRFSLLAELRRRRGQDRQRSVAEGVEGSFSDWDRMAEKIGEDAAYLDAAEELEADLSTGPAPSPPPPADVEDRLRELKRRMGK
jgi:phage shock protein A